MQNRGRSSTAAARVVYEISDSKKTAMKFMEDKRDATDKDLIEDSIKNPDPVVSPCSFFFTAILVWYARPLKKKL